jgi:trehalose 6-phosphate phosphatase
VRSTLPPRPDPSWAYFLDIDGTLVRIAKSPGAVRVTPGVRRLIETLFRSTGGAVALITGRRIADVDRLFPGIRLAVAGQHGAERRGGSAGLYRHPVPSPRLAAVQSRLAEIVGRHPGLVLEDKGLSLALHYRSAPQLGSYAHRLVRAMATPLGTAYCVQAGKCVVEVRPTGKDKGTAIREFMKDPNFHGRTPIFLGDDATDEYGFAVVNRLGGHSVKVGPGRTVARWRLPDVAGVRAWLQRGRPVPTPTS